MCPHPQSLGSGWGPAPSLPPHAMQAEDRRQDRVRGPRAPQCAGAAAWPGAFQALCTTLTVTEASPDRRSSARRRSPRPSKPGRCDLASGDRLVLKESKLGVTQQIWPVSQDRFPEPVLRALLSRGRWGSSRQAHQTEAHRAPLSWGPRGGEDSPAAHVTPAQNSGESPSEAVALPSGGCSGSPQAGAVLSPTV